MKLHGLNRTYQLTLLFLLSMLSMQSHAATPVPVLLDTDFTANSFIYFAKDKDINLKAITIACSGEVHCKPGKENAISILNLMKAVPKIPVASGSPYPLDGYFAFPKQWRNAIDHIGSTNVIKSVEKKVQLGPPTYKPSKLSAVELIHKTIQDSKEPITILADGPLTNIAAWLMKYPKDVKNVSHVVIMGGALDAKGNIIVKGFTGDHPNTKAEWNFFVDPLSVKIVFNSPLKITLVPLDATNYMRVTKDYAEHFDTLAHTPEAKFISNYFKINSEFIASGEYYFWDELADIIVTHPELCMNAEKTPLSVAVDYVTKPHYLKTSDLSMPKTRWDGKQRRHINAATSGIITRSDKGTPITVCMKTDPKVAFKLFDDVVTK